MAGRDDARGAGADTERPSGFVLQLRASPRLPPTAMKRQFISEVGFGTNKGFFKQTSTPAVFIKSPSNQVRLRRSLAMERAKDSKSPRQMLAHGLTRTNSAPGNWAVPPPSLWDEAIMEEVVVEAPGGGGVACAVSEAPRRGPAAGPVAAAAAEEEGAAEAGGAQPSRTKGEGAVDLARNSEEEDDADCRGRRRSRASAMSAAARTSAGTRRVPSPRPGPLELEGTDSEDEDASSSSGSSGNDGEESPAMVCKQSSETRRHTGVMRRASEQTMMMNLKSLAVRQKLRYSDPTGESAAMRVHQRKQVGYEASKFNEVYARTVSILSTHMTLEPPARRRHSIDVPELDAYNSPRESPTP